MNDQGTLRLDMKKKINSLLQRVIKKWKRQFGEVVEPPSLEMFTKYLDVAQGEMI